MGLQRSINFKVKENEYSLSFPTVGQVIDIESTKSKLSNGTYGDLVRAGTITAGTALDQIDMFSYFSILCPDLIADLKVSRYQDLDIFDAKELLLVYRKDVLPWVAEWQKVLSVFEPDVIAEQGIEDQKEELAEELEGERDQAE